MKSINSKLIFPFSFLSILLIVGNFLTNPVFASGTVTGSNSLISCNANFTTDPEGNTINGEIDVTNTSGSDIDNIAFVSVGLNDFNESPSDMISTDLTDNGWYNNAPDSQQSFSYGALDYGADYGSTTFTNGETYHIQLNNISNNLGNSFPQSSQNVEIILYQDRNIGGNLIDSCTVPWETPYFTEITPTATPTPVPSVQIVTNPSSSNVTVGTPFNVDVDVNDNSTAFNATKATVSVSTNLSITGIHNATSNACNFQYTKHPTTSDPSFAGAIYGGSSTGCTVYTMTLTPTATGTGTITFTNGSIKSYSDSSEILTGTQGGSFTIGDGPTPTPTTGLNQLTVTSPLQTYYLDNMYTLTGTKDASITTVYVNGSSSGVTYPTDTTWQVSETLAALGGGNTPSDNNFTIYGTDDNGDSTASQTVDVRRHTLGDINGDGTIDLTDASLFADDWGKTDPSAFTYALSDMNGDGVVDLTDLSILAKLEE